MPTSELAIPATPLDRREAAKAIVLTVAAIALFLTPVPAYLTGCAVAGIVLTSRRMHSRTMLGLVDWQMLALFVALFIVTRGLELSGWTEAGQRALAEAGLPLAEPASWSRSSLSSETWWATSRR